MIQHILKIIWKERASNFWIFLEIVFIFSILWFCTDYATAMYRRYLKPTGFNIENTYQLTFILDDQEMEQRIEETGKTKEEIVVECGWTMFDRLKRHPDIEHAAVSYMMAPYFSGNMSRRVDIDTDTTKMEYADYYGSITPEYFDVFKIPIERGRVFTLEDQGTKNVIINITDDFQYGKQSIGDIQKVALYQFRTEEPDIKDVIGIVGKGKRDPYENYRRELYEPIEAEQMSMLVTDYLSLPISFRVKLTTNTDGFEERFVGEMYDQLSVSPLYLSTVTPYEAIRDKYMMWRDYSNNFKSITAIMSFLLANVFLGLIGTFWFRTRQRRGEIGLRMAMGSSRAKVKQVFIGETLLIVTAACLLGTLISLNISITDILVDAGLPVIHNRSHEDIDWMQYLLNFGVTSIIIATVSTLAVWYPVRQAAKIEPANALRDE